MNRLHKINPNKYTNPRCRACRAPNETMRHLLTCPGIYQVRELVSRLITALGGAPHNIHRPTTTLLLLDSNYKLLSELPRAVIRIFWRITYASLTKAGEERKRYQPAHTQKAICRSLMLRILAYQKHKRDFFLKRVYTHKVSVVTRQEARRVLPLGKIDINGRLEINPNLKKIMQEFEVWKDFNDYEEK